MAFRMDTVEPTSQFERLVAGIGHLTPEERLVSAYLSVRDIPYGGANSPNPFDVLLKNRGTGKGKHMLLKLVFQSLGHEVTQLKRVAFGPLALGKLLPGEFRSVTPAEIKKLS